MTRKTVKHDYSDEHITQCEIVSTNNDGNNDFAIIHTKYDFKRYKLGLTMADLKMTLDAMGYEITERRDNHFIGDGVKGGDGGAGLPGYKSSTTAMSADDYYGIKPTKRDEE